MGNLEDLRTHFEAINVQIDTKTLEKCQELCLTYNIEPEEFVDQWLAYTASNLNGEPPSLAALERLERKELMKQRKTVTSKSGIKTTSVGPSGAYIHEDSIIEKSVPSQPVTPKSGPSQIFVNRNNPCAVLYKFGEGIGKRRSTAFVIKSRGDNEKMKYMLEKFLLKQNAFNAIARRPIYDILKFNNLELSEKKLQHHLGEMVIAGRVCGESFGKLEPDNLVLEGFVETYKGQPVKLSLNSLDNVSVFSGQNIVIKGDNTKNCFVAKELYTGAPLPAASTPTFTENLQIMVAAGPYTLSENLLYEPLQHLLKFVIDVNPNVLILMGPFIEDTHPLINKMCESFDTFFENLISGVMDQLKQIDIQVVLVPSHKDVHNHIIFPCLPYKIRKRHDNLHLVSNPFHLDIEGLIVSGCAADALFHLSKAEYSRFTQQADSRIGRLLTHIFNQRCLYPIYPPDKEIRVDYQLMEHCALLDQAPHLMILPSNFKHFVKVVEDCVVVNPERLIKGSGVGTFARIEIGAGNGKMCDRVSCQIYNI